MKKDKETKYMKKIPWYTGIYDIHNLYSKMQCKDT